MNNDNIEPTNALSPEDQLASNRSGLWVSVLIAMLGILLFSLVVSSSSQGENPLINAQSKLFIAGNDNDDIANVMQLSDDNWQKVDQSNFGLSTKAHWFSSDIPASQNGQPRLIEVSFAGLDYIDIWFVDNTGADPRIIERFVSGDNYAFDQRTIQHDQFIFAVPETRSAIKVYLRVETKGGIKVPIKLWQEDEYIQFIASHRVLLGLFYGFMAAMALINLFLFVTSRNVSTLLYTGYVVCLSLTLATSQGLAYRFLWPDSVIFQQHAVLIFASAMVFFSSSFTERLLDIKERYKGFYRFFSAIRIVIILYILLIFVLPFSIMVSILALVILMPMGLIFASTIYIAFKGNSVARYLAAAWCSLLFSGLLAFADSLNWISLDLDPSYLMMVGAIIETLFMALGLAMRFNEQRLAAKSAHIRARENKLKAMRVNEELVQLQAETKEQLEYAVGERSYELEIAIRELNEANHELERKTSIDPLTGVANRRLYDKKVLAEARRSRREQTPLAIAMIDIDHFKAINDTYGHQCGDEALKHFANLLNDCIKRPSDTICRYGGEEFVAILPNTDLEGAATLMESVRAATEAAVLKCGGNRIQFTVSIGLSTRVIASESEAELLNAFADKLLYKAKNAGRNQVVSAAF